MNDDDRWLLLEAKRHQVALIKTLTLFTNSLLDPITFKGWAIARYYPAGKVRQYNDIDLAVAAEDFEKSDELRHSDELKHCRIDLHKELRDLDTVPWQTVFARTRLIKIEETDIRVLCPEDHLRVLCSHWLMDGGEFKHRLWDIYYLIDATRETFDWEICLGDISANRREWIECVVGLTHKYFDLNIDDLPFAERVRDLPKWLTDAVETEWNSGVPQRPIMTTLNDREEFVKQFKKRIKPNPLRAVVDMDGSFYKPKLFRYRIGSFVKRGSAMIKRVGIIAFNR